MDKNLESAVVATEWWVEKISKPTWYDMGEPGRTGEIASLLALMLASTTRENLREENVEKFRETLLETIQKQIKERGTCTLNVDYAPYDILGEVAVATKIDSSLFPWKTHMTITCNEVKVAEGYGSEFKTIYPVKGNIKSKDFTGKN